MNPEGLFQTKSGPVIIMGNGPSLADMPDEFLAKYPTFGCNTIHLRRGFKPSYWAAADRWVLRYVDEILAAFPDIPKFAMIATNARARRIAKEEGCLVGPGSMPLSKEQSDQMYMFQRRPNPVCIYPSELTPGHLMKPGISLMGITHAMIGIALFMGHDKFYLVGCDNTSSGEHFYPDKLNNYNVESPFWEWAFDTLQESIRPLEIINLSTRGKINCLPWADWRNL